MTSFVFVQYIHTKCQYGYTFPNGKADKIVPSNKAGNCRILCAISSRGIIAYQIIVGAFKATLFAPFTVGTLLTKLEKVIILDIVKLRHSRVVLSAITRVCLLDICHLTVQC